MIFRAVCLAAALACSTPTWAQGQSEALGLLSRAVSASEKTSYAGTFVYQSGTNVETSHIAHHVDAAGNSVERLEVLDGSPREVVRVNDEVRCYLPKEKVVIEDRRGSRKTFPSLLPEAVGSLADFYSIKLGPQGRVAGFDTHSRVSLAWEGMGGVQPPGQARLVRISAMRSPISTQLAMVATEAMRGMIELSAMRRFLMPFTRSWASTTALLSLPMRQVPAWWK